MSHRRPDNVKNICGTERKDRAISGDAGADFDALDCAPEVPDWLPNEHALVEWHRLVPVLMKLKLLNEANVSALGHLCALHGVMVKQWNAGVIPSGSVVQQYRSFVGEFGLTPATSAKVKAGGGEVAANRFTGHGPRARS